MAAAHLIGVMRAAVGGVTLAAMAIADAAPASLPPTASPEERRAFGRQARKRTPRSAHGEWAPASDRRDAVAILEEESADRVPELVPLRYARMLASPFSFFRGAAAIMAADLAGTPTSALWVQACGDAHLSNFGMYASPSRDLVADVNDFDETLPGPWEWDLKRLVASFEVAGRDRGFDQRERQAVVTAAAGAYRAAMARLAGMRNLDVWYLQVDVAAARERVASQLSGNRRKIFDRNIASARQRTSMRAFSKLTERVDGRLRIASDPPVLVRLDDLYPDAQGAAAAAQIHELLDDYRDSLAPSRRHLLESYRFVDIARKVVGVGSVGTRCWIVLLVGRDEGDPLFLQVKEASRSVLEPYSAPSPYANQGQRVVEGQQLIQATSDILLGWLTATGIDGQRRDFYVRQLWDQKGSALIDTMDSGDLALYARVCGAILARAHARSGDRIAIAAYLGRGDAMDRALTRFAATYADQNERDFEALAAAAASGQVPVHHETD